MVKAKKKVRVVSVGSLKRIRTFFNRRSDTDKVTARIRYRRIGLLKKLDRFIGSEPEEHQVEVPAGIITRLLCELISLVRFSQKVTELINTIMGIWKK